MTLVLAHGALGYWDEAIGLTLLVIGLPTGVMIALLKGSSGRGTASLRGNDPLAAGPASRIGESGDEADGLPDGGGHPSEQGGYRS